MSFTSRAFRRNRATALAMELQASLADEQRLDRGCDGQVGRVGRFLTAIERWLELRAPATSHVFVLLGGGHDGVRGYRAVDALRDRENAKHLAIARELAGMLDRLDVVTSISPTEAAAAPLEAGKLPERSGVAAVLS